MWFTDGSVGKRAYSLQKCRFMSIPFGLGCCFCATWRDWIHPVHRLMSHFLLALHSIRNQRRWRIECVAKTKRENTMTEDTNSESELSAEELDEVAGGSKNADNPIVKTVMGAFNDAKKAAEAARLKELARSSGGSLGSTTSSDSFRPL
jgi:hypothetical protein